MLTPKGSGNPSNTVSGEVFHGDMFSIIAVKNVIWSNNTGNGFQSIGIMRILYRTKTHRRESSAFILAGIVNGLVLAQSLLR